MICDHSFHMTCKWLDIRYNRKRGVNGEGTLFGLSLPFEPRLPLIPVFFTHQVLQNSLYATTLCPASSSSTPRPLSFILRVILHFISFLFFKHHATSCLLSPHPACYNSIFHHITLLIQSPLLHISNPQTILGVDSPLKFLSLFLSPSIPNMLTLPSPP